MSTRREVIFSTLLPLIGSLGSRSSFATAPIDAVIAIEKQIATRRISGKPVSATWLANSMRSNLDPIGQRIAVFELVRRVPYRLTAWTGDPDSLFNAEKGDCRHKAAAGRRLLNELGFQARQIVVVFDWANLPIPPDILNLLPDTKSFHDSVEVRVDGRWVVMDPTWDPALKAAGFPIMTSWGGVGPTLEVTAARNPIVRFENLPKNVDLYEYFQIGRPQRKRTQLFNRAFNAWLDRVRTAQT